MSCKCYGSGDCIGLKMMQKAVNDIREIYIITLAEDSEEKLKKHSHFENYCQGDGIHESKKCEFLEWTGELTEEIITKFLAEEGRKPYCVASYDNKGRVNFRDPTLEENPDFHKD